MVRISLPPAHHHRLPLGDSGDGAQADGLGKLIKLSCCGKLDQSDVIDDGITTILPVSFIILVDNKVPIIDLKFLDSREESLLVNKGAEVEHSKGHSELGLVLLLADGGCNKEPRRDEHSRADPDVNILNMYPQVLCSHTNGQSYLSYISSRSEGSFVHIFLVANKPREGKLPRSSFCSIDDLKES